MTGAIQGLTASYSFNLINFDFLRWHTYEQANWIKLDGLLTGLSQTRTLRGAWAPSTLYSPGDVVTDTSTTPNTAYVCQVAYTSGAVSFAADRATYPTYWIAGASYLSVANNLSEVPNTATARANLGVYSTSQVDTAIANVKAIAGKSIAGFLHGCSLVYNSATNLIVTTGYATDSTDTYVIALPYVLNKSLTALFAVGNGGGSLDTGTLAQNKAYHVFLIQRMDTGVVDVLTSLSATAPVLPANYSVFRRIGAFRTLPSSAGMIPFTQTGDEFILNTVITDYNSAPTAGTAIVIPLSTPTGVKCKAHTRISSTNASVMHAFLAVSMDEAVPVINTPPGNVSATGSSGFYASATLDLITDTSSQIRAVTFATGTSLYVMTYGWTDTRGRP